MDVYHALSNGSGDLQVCSPIHYRYFIFYQCGGHLLYPLQGKGKKNNLNRFLDHHKAATHIPITLMLTPGGSLSFQLT